MKAYLSTLALLYTVSAYASECEPQTPAQIARSAQVAFVGTIKMIEESPYKTSELCWSRTDRSPNCGGKLVTLNVIHAIRGNVGERATVISEDACYCLGSSWKIGTTYLVIAKQNTTGLPAQFIASNVCEGTGKLNNRAKQIIKEFGLSKQ